MKFIKSIIIFIAVLLIFSLTIPVYTQEPSNEDLFVSVVGTNAQIEKSPDPTIIRSRLVNIQSQALGQYNPGDSAPGKTDGLSSSLTLNLFEDVTLTAILERVEPLYPGGYTWVGKVKDNPLSQVVLVVQHGFMVGNISLPNSFYQIRYVADDIQIIHQIDQSAFPDEAEPRPATSSMPTMEQEQEHIQTDDGSVIDILVIYTVAARNGAGGTSQMEAEVNMAVAETNQSYANSQINQRIRLVALPIEISYTESGIAETDVNRLQNPGDGLMDVVHPYRHAYAADMVTLIVENLDACGRAFEVMSVVSTNFRTSAFNVTARNCATGNFSFGHELGHLMGARHDWFVDNTDGQPYTYNHGITYPPGRWRTVMAYDDACQAQSTPVNCTRIAYWSNPAVLTDTIPTGSQIENNALTLNNTAFAVANFVSGNIPAVYVDGAWTGNETGQSTEPFNTVTEGAFRSSLNGVVWIKPGNYPETLVTNGGLNLTINRPIELRVIGVGTVIIGQ